MRWWVLGCCVACGGTTIVSGPPRAAASVDASAETIKLCASACAKRTQCARENDEAVCNDQCATRLGRKIETLRREVVEDLIACHDKSSCAELKACRFEVQEKANERSEELGRERDESDQKRSGRDGG